MSAEHLVTNYCRTSYQIWPIVVQFRLNLDTDARGGIDSQIKLINSLGLTKTLTTLEKTNAARNRNLAVLPWSVLRVTSSILQKNLGISTLR